MTQNNIEMSKINNLDVYFMKIVLKTFSVVWKISLSTGALKSTLIYTHVQNYVYMHKFTDFSETMTYNLMNFHRMIHNIMTHKCKRKN